MAKSEKLFKILELIKDNSNLSPKDLAKHCNVSERAIYRYINTLSSAGIFISFENGGYKLRGDYRGFLKESDPKGLEAIKLILLTGMQLQSDEVILQYGREFIKLIDTSLPKRLRNKAKDIEIVPEEVRANLHGGTISIGQISKPEIINPILTSETISVTLMNLIFSSLVKFDSAQRPIPDAAKAWELSNDGLIWTFFIREDVVFHDGHPLTAHDVEFTYKSIIDPKNKSPMADRYDIIERIEAEGDYVVRIILKHPFVPFISRLGWAIAPRHLLEDSDINNTPFNRRPIGSGPFRLVHWSENNTIILDANREYYRKDRPILDRLIFKSYTDRKAALKAIAHDEIDIVLNMTSSDIPSLNKDNTFKVYSAAAAFCYALIFNYKDPVFRDIKVRKALDYAIDKESIIKNQLRGHGGLCTVPFNPVSWAYNPNVRSTPYNPERSRELLAQAGWMDNNGDGILEKGDIPFEISLTVSNIHDTLELIATAIKSQLMEIGIRVKTIYINDSEIGRTPFQAIITMIGNVAEPDYVCSTWHSESSGKNIASYQNRFVDNLMILGRQTAELEKRKAIYYRIHEMIHDDCPAIFISSAFEYIGSKCRFRNGGFSSTMRFINTMKDWRIVNKKSKSKVPETS